MAGYTVKQIAEMLGTNQETVRRWIREKKLSAVQTSRKDGNVVDEKEFLRFIKGAPKYASRLAKSLGPYSTELVLGILFGAVASNIVLDYMAKKKTQKTRSLPEDAKAFLEKSISELDEQIEQKTQAVQQLENEISDMQTKATAYRYLLE